MKLDNLESRFLASATGAAAVFLPSSPAFAADAATNGAVGIPLAISVLVMVPFLYYQQALRPKEEKRTAKQIELDGNLKVKNKSDLSSGKAGQAKAGKRK